MRGRCDMARVLFLVCAFCISVSGGTLAVKGYFCQDPDTGRLYGINATWPSTSFCGNYTCKIRLRSEGNMVQTPSTIVNITSNKYRMPKPNEADNQVQNSTKYNDNDIEVKRTHHENKELGNYFKKVHLGMGNGVDDRFLNIEEIKTISELLPTVKKSDLEAIIEIYNLAQDIYKEMDSVQPNDELQGNPNMQATAKNTKSISNIDNKSEENKDVEKISYWYEPLGLHGFRNNKQSDMKFEASEFKHNSLSPYEVTHTSQARQTTLLQPPLPQFVNIKLPVPLNPQLKLPVKPKIPPQPQIPLQPYPQSVPQPMRQHVADPTFFTGPLLTSRDFGRLAYYFPVSNLQKLPYDNQRAYEVPAQNIGVSPPTSRKSCYPGCGVNHYLHIYGDNVRPHPAPQKAGGTPELLPIPFTFQAYKGSINPFNYNKYYKGDPWAFYNLYKNTPTPIQTVAARQAPKRVKTDQPFIQTLGPSLIPHIFINPDMPEFQYDDLKPIDNIDDGKLLVPEKANVNDGLKPWQTKPLEQAVINDIRANIAERVKILNLPAKKRIKLDRVAKVIKLDHLNRNKRQADEASPVKRGSTENNETYEMFLEKTTCVSSTELGFFKVGNLSEPFPACCPQKIEG